MTLFPNVRRPISSLISKEPMMMHRTRSFSSLAPSALDCSSNHCPRRATRAVGSARYVDGTPHTATT
eukprot:6108662-Prymnesium_polylepis.1